MNIYLDNAATTFPKPKSVYLEIMNYMENIGANPGRGGYSNALKGDRIIYNCREALMNFFKFDKPENIIFTQNITSSLNILLKSVIKEDWHIITSSMEHNSVLRPLNAISKNKNIDIDIINCSKFGIIDVKEIKNKIKPNTKLIVLSHGSNIIGTVQPIEEIGLLCKQHNIYFIIDSAQTAGTIPIDFYKTNASAIAFTGHKSLLGPQGTGGFIISDELNKIALTYNEGGTGSLSESIVQPDFLPDKFESGTLNSPGIAGLLKGIEYINEIGLDAIKEKEDYLYNILLEGLLNMDSIKIYGYNKSTLKTAVVSFNSSRKSNSELAFLLDNQFGIMARSGLHCAPLAHKTIGSFPQGTLRFSIGSFNTKEDIIYTIDSLNTAIKETNF